MESSSTFKRIVSPNGNIEKIPVPLRSHISSPNLLPRWSPKSGNQTWLLLVIPYLSLHIVSDPKDCSSQQKRQSRQGRVTRRGS
ncbi:hypothetical protein AVEN_94422-1 [Araneus ventricosus]|uniref:Uncharacterized protein n=1 Tax=Araneus ventricosus TaxID=182803 RepID=A0A4Y2J1X9_ARAVE|nr:hypothetical protein AVEN_94422-1 [Araneus ventricosus]